MTRTIHCGSCGGSGYRMGSFGDIECIDCSGEGQWEVGPEEGDTGITLAEWNEALTEVHGDPFKNRRAA